MRGKRELTAHNRPQVSDDPLLTQRKNLESGYTSIRQDTKRSRLQQQFQPPLNELQYEKNTGPIGEFDFYLTTKREIPYCYCCIIFDYFLYYHSFLLCSDVHRSDPGPSCKRTHLGRVIDGNIQTSDRIERAELNRLGHEGEQYRDRWFFLSMFFFPIYLFYILPTGTHLRYFFFSIVMHRCIACLC